MINQRIKWIIKSKGQKQKKYYDLKFSVTLAWENGN